MQVPNDSAAGPISLPIYQIQRLLLPFAAAKLLQLLVFVVVGANESGLSPQPC
jgi:hypothetical protein